MRFRGLSNDMIYRVKVTPQVVDKFVFNRFKLIQRHPERSEGSPELDKIYLRFALDLMYRHKN